MTAKVHHPRALFNPIQMDSGQKKQMGNIQELIQAFIRLHWNDCRDIQTQDFSYKLVNDQVRLKTENGDYRPMVLSSMTLDDKDWNILYKISKVTKDLLLANLRKDAFYDSSSAFLPGSFGIVRLPKAIFLNRKDRIRAKYMGDEVGIREANIRYVNQGIALIASCAMAFKLVLFILEDFSQLILSIVVKTSIGKIASILGILASLVELLRLLSWIYYTNQTKEEFHIHLLNEIQKKIDIIGDSTSLSKEQYSQIKVMFTTVENAIKHEDEKLGNYKTEIINFVNQETPDLQKLKTALKGYKKRLIYLDFGHLTNIKDPEKHKELSRKLGAKFVLELQLLKDHIIDDMQKEEEIGFEKAEKLLRDADWQATKKMILYGLGIVCCVLAIAGCVGLSLHASIGLFIAGIIISTLLSYVGQKYFVDSSGFGILSNYYEEERKQEFIKRQQCILANHTHLLA